ncbi:hypothetical protein BC938DRAFT_479307 [Jimgerdemannia flammicorona]|uniref:Uncharacterized protein n=1 Tax=Jimgerdemannia flammicorona TaxID=994334 RepID=A0A433QL38_9FUNG|nr:hypothetical protein BC938DRAFT_479307 [Jimgerdemannia flammicorona]
MDTQFLRITRLPPSTNPANHSYQLGRYINPSTLSPSLTAIDDLPTLPSARETRRSMEKMQKLICLFSERLVMLEQEMSRARVSLPHQSYTADEGFALSASDVTTRLGIIGGSSTTYAAGLSTYPGQDDVVSSATPESSSPAKAAEIPPLSAAATSAPLPPLSPTTTITTFGNSLTSSSPRPTNLSTSDIAAGTNSQQGGPNPKQNESPRSLRPGARSIQDNVSVEVEPWSLTREKRRKEGNIAGEGRITRGNAGNGGFVL